MSEVTTDPAASEAEGTEPDEAEVEKKAFHARLNQESEKRKAAEKRARDAEARAQEIENASLPELERIKKDMERERARAEAAEAKAAEAEAKVHRSRKERWITAAAQEQNFADPSDASAFVSLDEIEDEKDAERAIKRLASQKRYLLRSEDPALPGKVLEGGQRTVTDPTAQGGIDASAEAQMLAEGLKRLVNPNR